MNDHGRHKVPLVLKFEDWPSTDGAAWNDLFISGGVFSDVGALVHWSDGGRKVLRQGYGQWLSFLLRTSPDKLGHAPVARVTPETVRSYLAECRERLAPRSILNLITALYIIARALEPAQDWSWLHRLTKRLYQEAETHALPRRHPITASEIFNWSLKRMAEVEGFVDVSAVDRAIWFRDALMIGFLISRPVRRRALLAMRIGVHLTGDLDGYMLTFPPEDMKDGRRHSFPLPDQLNQDMWTYLTVHRPVLSGEHLTDALWITRYGNPIMADGYARELPKVTLSHLGVELRPHAFRHIAATSIAEFDPEHVGIIRDILGHATCRMSEKHYNRAASVSACNALQEVTRRLRRPSE